MIGYPHVIIYGDKSLTAYVYVFTNAHNYNISEPEWHGYGLRRLRIARRPVQSIVHHASEAE